MSARSATLGMIVRIAIRNLFASRVKTFVLGGIILFGTVLVVVGGSLVNSVSQGMARSIIGSVAGNIQVYSAKSKDELAIWGSLGGDPDLVPIPDFAAMRDCLMTIDNIKTVVPMGIGSAMVQSGNTIDLTLAKLRATVQRRLDGDDSTQLLDEIKSQKEHIHQMIRVLQQDWRNIAMVLTEGAIEPEHEQYVKRAVSDEFWAHFDDDPLGSLEFLENRIAPLLADADFLFIRYVGTDLETFTASFDRLEMVDGVMVPPGQRGFLISKFLYEEMFKLATARRLDKIKEALTVEGRSIDGDPELTHWVKENTDQVREILLQLDARQTADVISRLQRALGEKDSDLTTLLAKLLKTNDQNFLTRYQLFYELVAPQLQLYRLRMGDYLTIKGITRSGYAKAINVKIYGTFQFKGIEKSNLAGSLNLMDLMSFRELYGYQTDENAEEIKKLQKESGVVAVAREKAEDQLFGSNRQIEVQDQPSVINENQILGAPGMPKNKDIEKEEFSRAELEHGIVLNAAVILKDPRRLDETIDQIRSVSDRDGLSLIPLTWRQAAGVIGQLVLLMRIVLYTAVGIIFTVAIVIMSNATMMATLERVTEIGTLRAIGAQRRFILTMVVIETVVVGLVFGILGSLLGSAIVSWIHAVGIPAFSDIWQFFFSGPRLYPTLGVANLIAAFVLVLACSLLSSLYPAWLATRVNPVLAIQTEE